MMQNELYLYNSLRELARQVVNCLLRKLNIPDDRPVVIILGKYGYIYFIDARRIEVMYRTYRKEDAERFRQYLEKEMRTYVIDCFGT